MEPSAKKILQSARGRTLNRQERFSQAVLLAERLMKEAAASLSRREERQIWKWSKILDDSEAKNFLSQLTDQCFRSRDAKRVVDQILYRIRKQGIPASFTGINRFLLKTFEKLASWFPRLFTYLLQSFIRRETRPFILSSASRALHKHLKLRKEEGIRVNLNLLGEAILGEEEAEKRVEFYLNALADPAIEVVSVKISSIFSQMNLLSWEDSVQSIAQQLKRLYAQAKKFRFRRTNGEEVPKFVYLDMEEYSDLSLTVAAFQKALEDPDFFDFSAGLALQSYIPDSWLVQQELTTWAQKRVANGGAPITIRLVKGANLSMEKVISSLSLWSQAPYTKKTDSDANLLRMLEYACEPKRIRAVHIGLGSHNLFLISYALLLREERNLENFLELELLEGMANPFLPVLKVLSSLLVYCPIATKENFQNAVAYFVRRLEENTSPENFLNHSFDLEPSAESWETLVEQFYEGLQKIESVSDRPRRLQNRLLPVEAPQKDLPFRNEPDTDWTTVANRKWGERILREQSAKSGFHIPCVIAGKELRTKETKEGRDPSFPEKVLYTASLASREDAEQAIKQTQKGQKVWEAAPLKERSHLLYRVAECFRRDRGVLIGIMVADGGKTIAEADKEFSEAIDFLEYYRRNVEEYGSFSDVRWKPRGTVLVAPPWNFPCSIPVGGISSALAMGNGVIFKPAPETIAIGWEVVKRFWEGGVSPEVLQFLPCQDQTTGTYLIQHPGIDSVVLTGATETAQQMLRMRPQLDLHAETGGKNTMILSNMADRDLAIRDLVHSAFGHSGQKCSACSLAIVFKEWYDDPSFRNNLRDAVKSLKVGTPWDRKTKIPPLIRPPGEALLRGLTQLEPGEEWILKPQQDPKNPHLWSPGIKWGVREGSFTHQTELFGPVLGVMRAENLEHALRLANGTRYGLTGGIHSLDEREQKRWVQNIHVGNGYINRAITGSIVQRQPFGGIKESCFGFTFKSGGPQSLIPLGIWEETGTPEGYAELPSSLERISQDVTPDILGEEDFLRWKAALHNYAFYWMLYFSIPQDPSLLLGQDNFLFYIPKKQQNLRIQQGDSLLSIYRAAAGALVCGSGLTISGGPGILPSYRPEGVVWIEEEEEAFLDRLAGSGARKVRFLHPPSSEWSLKLVERGFIPIVQPSLSNGRLELLNHLREMAVSIDYHRYGNLGTREKEQRSPLPGEMQEPFLL